LHSLVEERRVLDRFSCSGCAASTSM
jgi:hypothetical protein